jgi:transcriptional regulator with XRE-family HTH domain
MPDDPLRDQLTGLGRFIREQRQQAQLTLRELADRANVSNPYLSQIERGLHEPSVRVLSSIAAALDLSAGTLLSLLGLGTDDEAARPETEEAIRRDPLLTNEQRSELLAVYRAYVAGAAVPDSSTGDDPLVAMASADHAASEGENDQSGP